MSHTEGEPYFFTFGKSEVLKSLHALFVYCIYDNDIMVTYTELVSLNMPNISAMIWYGYGHVFYFLITWFWWAMQLP